MSSPHVVIEDHTGQRATVSIDALPIHELRGFTVVGPAFAPDDPRTAEEAAEEHRAAVAQREAVLNPAHKRTTPANKKERK